jgi:hypothetical protein
VLDQTLGPRLFRTIAPGDEVGVLDVPSRIKVGWNRLSNLVG